MDVSAIAGAMGALKATKDILATLVNVRDAAAFQEKRIELQSLMIDAQSSVFAANEERSALIHEVADLKIQLQKLSDWKEEKLKYILAEIGNGVFAYSLAIAGEGREPSHFLCANCFEDQRKSILQKIQLAVGRAEAMGCQHCKALTYTRGAAHAEHAPILARYR